MTGESKEYLDILDINGNKIGVKERRQDMLWQEKHLLKQ